MDQFEAAHSRWPIKKVEEVSVPDGIAIGPFGSKMKSDCYVDSGVPVIRGSNVDSERHFQGDFVYITEKKADELKSSNVLPDDLVFPHRGSIGEVGLVPQGPVERWMLSTSLMKFTPDTNKLLPEFAYYYFRSEWGRRELLKNASTVGTPGIGTPLASLRSIRIPVPPLPIQRRIADILGALDDKIELNRQMNETLEAMAQALYRHWFVDFGPFQDQPFVDSDLGPIPEGWHAGSLDEIAKNVRGTIDPDEFPDSTPYIGLGEMPKGSIQLDTWDVAAEAGSRKRSFKKGQILFGKLRPYFKKVGIAPVDGICSTDMLVLEPTTSHFRSMALCQLIQDEFIDYTDRASTGTRMPRISWKRMRDYDVAIPPESIAELYESKVGNWLDLIVANIHESRALAETRDYLLPKLISGEIEVEAAEEHVESAAA